VEALETALEAAREERDDANKNLRDTLDAYSKMKTRAEKAEQDRDAAVALLERVREVLNRKRRAEYWVKDAGAMIDDLRIILTTDEGSDE
jgi:hypothetical protein